MDYLLVLGTSVLWAKAMLSIARSALDELI